MNDPDEILNETMGSPTGRTLHEEEWLMNQTCTSARREVGDWVASDLDDLERRIVSRLTAHPDAKVFIVSTPNPPGGQSWQALNEVPIPSLVYCWDELLVNFFEEKVKEGIDYKKLWLSHHLQEPIALAEPKPKNQPYGPPKAGRKGKVRRW